MVLALGLEGVPTLYALPFHTPSIANRYTYVKRYARYSRGNLGPIFGCKVFTLGKHSRLTTIPPMRRIAEKLGVHPTDIEEFAPTGKGNRSG